MERALNYAEHDLKFSVGLTWRAHWEDWGRTGRGIRWTGENRDDGEDDLEGKLLGLRGLGALGGSTGKTGEGRWSLVVRISRARGSTRSKLGGVVGELGDTFTSETMPLTNEFSLMNFSTFRAVSHFGV